MRETYDRLVPHVYTPEPGIMAEILKQVDVNGALELVPRLWSDMVQFDHVKREPLLHQVLRIMVDNRPRGAEELPAHAGLERRFADIGWQVWEMIETQQEGRTNQLSWTGEMLGDVLALSARIDEWERAVAVFDKLDKEAHRVAGNPSAKAVEEFVQLCVAHRQPSKGVAAVQMHVERGLGDSGKLARVLRDGLQLDAVQLSKIAALVGDLDAGEREAKKV